MMADPKSPDYSPRTSPGKDSAQISRAVFVDRAELTLDSTSPEPRPRKDEKPGTSASSGLLSTGIEILSGPAQGRRILFTRSEVALGVGNEIVMIISRDGDHYFAQKSEETFKITINGEVIDDESVTIEDDDQISFANLSVRFFVE